MLISFCSGAASSRPLYTFSDIFRRMKIGRCRHLIKLQYSHSSNHPEEQQQPNNEEVQSVLGKGEDKWKEFFLRHKRCGPDRIEQTNIQKGALFGTPSHNKGGFLLRVVAFVIIVYKQFPERSIMMKKYLLFRRQRSLSMTMLETIPTVSKRDSLPAPSSGKQQPTN